MRRETFWQQWAGLYSYTLEYKDIDLGNIQERLEYIRNFVYSWESYIFRPSTLKALTEVLNPDNNEIIQDFIDTHFKSSSEYSL